ncbi:Dihydroorotate dehydrogenase (quinone), mitochondrial [Lecanosticta acicola]|uniref:Dihydroorotate dehydrogenase (quinone), mitochondrial n=1 Tax=Lecanosticta acicola TaxID=111012 RepID=A0AAI8Z667_9PEZI|nr:Dihydroorotate dehydrogenase (quinone), mitochondrial [Lecanosticta acicola]
MSGTRRLLSASTQLLRHDLGLNRSRWRSLQRQCHRQLSLHSGRTRIAQNLRYPRRYQSNTSDAAKKGAEDAAKSAEQTAKQTGEAAKSAATTAAKKTASGGSRVIAYIYGTGLVLLLSFGYLYVTDTRASIHQYLSVPLVRLIHSDAEEAHHAGVRYIKGLYDFNLHPRERGNADQELGDLRVEVFGHILDNPIGTSAGIDKDAEIPSALFALGPAVVEVGGATPLPQEGNPKPRVFRIPSQNALINRYGLNSEGAEHVAMQLRERVRSYAYDNGIGLGADAERIVLDGEAEVPPGSLVPGKLLAVQVAKNKTTPDDDIAAIARDYVFCVDRLAKYADILVVNVSSPNTPGLRDLQATAPLTAILTAVVDTARATDRKTKPAVMVKVSPDEDSDAQVEGICSAVWASGVDGVIVGNTTKKRPDPIPQGYIMPANETRILNEVGGYSGPQMFQRTLDLVKRYRTKLDQGPQDDAPSRTPASSREVPVDDTKSSVGSVDESVKRDANRLKPLTAEAEKDSKQPLVQLPDRHSSESTSEKARGLEQAASTDVSNSAPASQPTHTTREAAQGALDKIISADGTEKKSSANTPSPVEPLPAKVIFATGGITNGEQCLDILNAGASVCQVYTAMMYGGVGTITRMKSEMRDAIKKQQK